MSATKSSMSSMFSNTVFVVVSSLLVVGLLATLVMRQRPSRTAESFANASPVGGKELSTRYFTRFYIPVVLSILAIAFVVVLLTMSPGLPLNASLNL